MAEGHDEGLAVKFPDPDYVLLEGFAEPRFSLSYFK